jgi:outer membrane protein assembly factor BamE (lipoprotein component of BamABCDE complex)
MISMTPECFSEKELLMKRLPEIIPGLGRGLLTSVFSVALLLVLLVSSGCTTEEGTRVSTVSLMKLKTGVSTMADVKNVLGPPDRVENRFGEQVWVYRHRVIKGLFYRHTTGKNIAISFDEKGVIRQVRSSSVDSSEAF